MKLSIAFAAFSLLVLLVTAQSFQQPPKRDSQAGSQVDASDPIGNYNIIVRGTVKSGGRVIGGLSGLMARLSVPQQDAVLTTSFLMAFEADDLKDLEKGENPDPDAFTHTLSIQRGNVMDFFMNVMDEDDLDDDDDDDDDRNSLGVCSYSSSDDTQLNIGEWQQLDQTLAQQHNCSGNLWLREMTGAKETDKRTELFCVSDNKEIVWIELGHPQQDVVVHLEVVGLGEEIPMNQQGFSLFALPIGCVINPVQSNQLTGLDRPDQLPLSDVRKSSTMGRMFKGAALGAMAGLASSWLLPSR